nr:S8 family serine peptidase [Bacteroidales bacterium]
MRTSYKLPIRWLLLALAVAWGGAAWAQAGNLAKIDPELQELIHLSRDANERFRIIVEMTEQYDNPNLERGTAMMTRAQRRDYVVNELKRFSEQSQTEVVNYLTAQSTRGQVNVLHRFWIFNGLSCEATAECIDELSMRHDVRFLSLDKEQQMISPIEPSQGRGIPPQSGVQWHVSKVQADRVWNEKNIKGRGVVVAILDSGVNYNHPDIINNMWVWYDDENQNPVYGWDFINDDSDPMDDNGHGTNVAGITASNGATYQMGIAPNASIMALKVTDSLGNWRDRSSVCSAVEFAVEHGADVLNLSIGEYGVGGVELFRNTFVNVMNAGVVASVAGGNSGHILNEYPVPFNIGAPGNCPPPWHNPNQVSFSIGNPSAVICVGNTNQNDIRYYESSIGPVTWSMGSYIGDYNDYLFFPESPTDISGLVRPDVSAPGTDIWSLAHDYDGQNNQNDPYSQYTGTSQAAPCVAGVIALMLEANPNLTPAKIDSILETTAVACDGQTLKNNEYGAGRVDAFAAVTAATHWCDITAVPIPPSGGTVSGSGTYLSGNTCTLNATPNLGYAFKGWYNVWETICYSTQPEYTFTVTQDRTLTAKFLPANYTITLNASPASGGTISGDGTYPAGSVVTLTATAASGYYFNGWVENGILLTNATTYVFAANANRNLTAIFSTTMPQVFDGIVVTNPDGSKGVVFYTNPMGTGGTMVALDDASEGCPWGDETDIGAMQDYLYGYSWDVLNDKNGYANTEAILNHQGEGTGYAADVVDFEHGWYLPSANQLRKLYGALPFIEEAI